MCVCVRHSEGSKKVFVQAFTGSSLKKKDNTELLSCRENTEWKSLNIYFIFIQLDFSEKVMRQIPI